MITRFDTLFAAYHRGGATARDLLADIEAVSYEALEDRGLFPVRRALRKLRQDQRLRAAEDYLDRHPKRAEYICCILRDEKHTLCGLSSYRVWCFQSVEHAMATMASGSRLLPCPECLAAAPGVTG